MLYALYGTLGTAAFLACLWERNLRWVGAWLLVGFAVSNLLDWYAPLAYQIAGYTAIEMLIAVAAICATTTFTPKAPLLGIVALNLLSIGVNGIFALNSINNLHDQQQKLAWEVTTNIIFAMECAVAIGVGSAHVVRTGVLHRGLRLCRAYVSARIGRTWPPA